MNIDTNPKSDVRAALIALRDSLELDLRHEMALKDALTLPNEQIEAELVAAGFDLADGRERLSETLKRRGLIP